MGRPAEGSGSGHVNAAPNELTTPLGHSRPAPRGPGRLPFVLRAALLVSGFGILAAFAGTALYGDQKGGRPVARAEIAVRPAADRASSPSNDTRTASAEPSRRDAEAVEAASGVSVVRPAGTSAPASVIVRVPEPASATLARSPDPRLIEKARNGLLPRIGPDGARALDVYARPPAGLPDGAQPSGRIAIVLGGLGISRTATEDAISGLPGPVSLAFAPYGQDLERHAERARAAGHEVLLQVPMEPFDYPDSDPGPHTLIAAAKPAENIDRLHWAMGRFTGYVAIMNYMGAKLTSDERALAPILREAGQRGLGVLDDGSSSRSLVAALAGETRAARADMVLDAVPRADLIDKALEKLEAQASGSGAIVVATASALPVTLDRIGRWAKGLEARGILLVPASAALADRPRESARR